MPNLSAALHACATEPIHDDFQMELTTYDLLKQPPIIIGFLLQKYLCRSNQAAPPLAEKL